MKYSLTDNNKILVELREMNDAIELLVGTFPILKLEKFGKVFRYSYIAEENLEEMKKLGLKADKHGRVSERRVNSRTD